MDLNELSQEPTADAGNADLESLLQEGYGFTPLKRGDVREGVIVGISSSEIMIDLSGKTEGIVSGRELERMPKEMLSSIKVGDEVLAYVVNPEDKNGNIILSLTRAQMEKDWREAEQLFESQEMFPSQVAGYNKGGLIVRLGRVRGFVPASQLDTSRHPRLGQSGLTPEERWGHLVGETLQLKVIEIDRDRNRLILSERAAMREWKKLQKDKLLSELTEGEVREGRVISLADFGAFVDLGGADGLIHLSELSWKRVNHPREVLRVGEEVTVYVLNVDRDRKRIGLSLKRLQPDPWSLVDDKYHVDQLVEGVITKLAKFGAFACVVGDEEIEGLIHISELSEDHIEHPKEVVQEGQVVTLRIIRIDTDQRRMGLSLKRVDQAEYADLDWQAELAAAQEEEAEIDTAEAVEAEAEVVAEVLAEPEEELVAPDEVSAEAEAEASAAVETLVEVAEAEAEVVAEVLAEPEEELVAPDEVSAEAEAEASAAVETLVEVAEAEAEVVAEILTEPKEELVAPDEVSAEAEAEASAAVETSVEVAEAEAEASAAVETSVEVAEAEADVVASEEATVAEDSVTEADKTTEDTGAEDAASEDTVEESAVEVVAE
jgi:small subunit ribosomal protein S1